MKHLWIINHYAQKPNEFGIIRHHSLAKHLLQHGWKTSIIANSVEFNTYRQRLKKEENHRLEKEDGVDFLWLKAPSYTGNGYGRMWNMLCFTKAALNLRHVKLLDKPDIIIGSTVHPFAAWAGLQIARHYSAPFIFEIRDLWPETLIQFGYLSRHSPLSLALVWLEKKLAREAVHIISALPKVDDYFSRYDIPPNKITWIPNCASIEELKPIPDIVSEHPFMITYFGAHGNANSLETLIDAFNHINKKANIKNIRCQLIGSGPLKRQLQNKAASLGLDNIDFQDPVPRNKLSAHIRNTDAFLLCAKNFPELYRYGISMNKLFHYMSLGKPIVASLEAVNNPVTEEQCGICVAPESPVELANAIVKISNTDEKKREQMGNNGMMAIRQKYNYEILANKLAIILNGTSPDRVNAK